MWTRHQETPISSMFEQKQQVRSQHTVITNFRPASLADQCCLTLDKKTFAINSLKKHTFQILLKGSVCLKSTRVICKSNANLGEIWQVQKFFPEDPSEVSQNIVQSQWCISKVLYSSDNNYKSHNSKQNHTKKEGRGMNTKYYEQHLTVI